MGAMKTTVLSLCVLAGVIGLGGCGSTPGVTLTGVESGRSLTLEPTLSVYRYSDKNTADMYMTDLPRDVFDPQADLSGVSGQLTHVHLFVAPEAGKTPIDDTACSVTFRHIVLANGQIGVYGGGGFLYPKRRPGGETLKGRIRGATLRLVSATAGFDDKLRAVEVEARVNAMLDEPMSGALDERLRSFIDLTTPVKRAEDTAANAKAEADQIKDDAKPAKDEDPLAPERNTGVKPEANADAKAKANPKPDPSKPDPSKPDPSKPDPSKPAAKPAETPKPADAPKPSATK